MKCRECEFENPPAMHFCGQCGTQLALLCPRCGTEGPHGFRFCGQCGASLQAPPAPKPPAPVAPSGRLQVYTPKHLAEKILKERSALEGERRQVTVLFADLAGFAALAEQRDPEEVHQIIDRCFELITGEVHRFEGTINQYTGDGVMALFGAPIAHEDSPRRAVHAALGIQGALRDYSRELQARGGPVLQIRIGLHSGPVVVGRIGDDLRMDYTAVGDTTNLAARLQQVARPGGVLISEANHKLVAGFFETLDLGELPLKGHAPVWAFEVLRPRGRRARLDVAVERGLTPLVGRVRELARLLDLFEEVKLGRGQVVFLIGEAGIGKSRLLLEFRRMLARSEEKITWLEGRGVSFGQTIPFLPLIEQLRECFQIGEFDGGPEIIAKVEHGMRRIGELEAHIPYVRHLLGVDPGDPMVSAMEATVRRKKTFEAVRALLLRGARLQPLLLVFEDLHWIDTSTEEYLGFVMDSVAGVPMMVLCTYRVGHTPPFGSRSFHSTLTLQSLSEADSLTMAGRVLGTEQFPAELKCALMAKAEGVPLFIEEVTKTLLDLGALRRENGGYRMAEGMAEVSVPDTIQGIIMARLDRLGEDGKRVVQLASVIGRQFLGRLLDRVAEMGDRLEGVLQELKASEIIYELGLHSEPEYQFKHAVIQDVAYNSLLVQRRKALHMDVGRAIEELYADRIADHSEELAHHFAIGEYWEKAFAYLVRSGDKAKAASANQAALDFYGRALEVSQQISPPLPPRRIMEVYQRRCQVWTSRARYPEAIAEAEQMLEIARASGDRGSEGEALVDLALAHWLTFSSEHTPHTKRYAEEAQRIAQETGAQRILARSLTYLGLVDQIEGDLTAADKKLEESLRISEAGGFKVSVAQNQTWLAAHANWRGEFQRALTICGHAARTAVETHDGFQELFALAFDCLARIGLGAYSEALAVMDDALRKARDRDNIFIQGRLTNTLGWLFQELGDFRRALEYDRESLDLGQRVKNPNVETSALINLGFDYLNLGETQRACSMFEDTLTRVEKFAFGAHRWRWTIHLTACLAQALLETGQPDRGLMYVEKGMALARATGSAKYIGKFHGLRGEIALRVQQWGQAEAALGEALQIARQIGYPTLTWQAAHQLARAQAGQNRREEALATARFAEERIDAVGGGILDPVLRQTFYRWSRVQDVREDLDRLRRTC